jgi:hypothetical protein
MTGKRLAGIIISLLITTQVSWAVTGVSSRSGNSELAVRNEQQSKLLSIIKKDLSLAYIAKTIWEDLIGAPFVLEIKDFKKQHPVPFDKYSHGATWISLKKELDINMVKPIPGANYSWEKFRDMDQLFKDNLVNKALERFGFGPVKWGAAGTTGYNSDIDNVAMGSSSFQEMIAKILCDTLHVYMYGTTSDITFDEQIYTTSRDKLANIAKSGF